MEVAPRPGVRRDGEAWIWAGLLLAAAVFVGLGFAGRAWLPAAGKPLEPPWFRTPQALFEAVQAMGADGRRQHRIGVLTLDTAIPLTYGWAMFRAARFYLQRLRGPATLAWIPVVAMLCDFAENACIVTLVSAWPARPGVAAALLVFSWTKWILLASTTLGILAGWVILRVRRA